MEPSQIEALKALFAENASDDQVVLLKALWADTDKIDLESAELLAELAEDQVSLLRQLIAAKEQNLIAEILLQFKDSASPKLVGYLEQMTGIKAAEPLPEEEPPTDEVVKPGGPPPPPDGDVLDAEALVAEAAAGAKPPPDQPTHLAPGTVTTEKHETPVDPRVAPFLVANAKMGETAEGKLREREKQNPRSSQAEGTVAPFSPRVKQPELRPTAKVGWWPPPIWVTVSTAFVVLVMVVGLTIMVSGTLVGGVAYLGKPPPPPSKVEVMKANAEAMVACKEAGFEDTDCREQLGLPAKKEAPAENPGTDSKSNSKGHK